MLKYKDKQQLLTAHKEHNPMHKVHQFTRMQGIWNTKYLDFYHHCIISKQALC